MSTATSPTQTSGRVDCHWTMSATRSDRLMTYRAGVKHVSGTAEAAELFRNAGFRVAAYRISLRAPLVILAIW